MNYLSLCSGIEAASVAWHPLGWNCVGVSEIEPFPCAVLAHRFPNVKNYGDMTKFTDWKIPDGTVDLLVGGTPCQSFSVAGLRQGLKDPRGNLMLTFLAIAEHLKPKWIVWENVPGVLSSNGGKDFGSFLGGLGQLGYGFAYRVLDAQWCRTHRHPRAVPQRRRRVFVVGCLGDFTSAAKVLFESESLQRYSAKGRAKRQGTSADVAGCIRSGGDGGVPSSREKHLVPCWWDGNNIASTLTRQNANGAQRMPDIGNFGAVLQPIASGSTLIQPLVIPILPQAMQAEGWRVGKENQDGRGNGLGVGKDGDACPTLDRSAVPAIAYSFDSLASNSMKSSNPVSGCNVVDVAKCIDTSIPCPSKNQGGIAVAMVNMQGSKSNACVTDDGSSYTTNAMHGHDVHAVVVGQVDWRTTNNDSGQVSQTLKTDLAHQSGPCLAVTAPEMQVRRLTPTECERLQGFPDSWTLIPYRGKSAENCPDGARYKALGNSMAVNCMEWIGQRINALHNAT